ncbi:hypothetical protein GUJ93_ZPchr0001g29695 [Zizania palustris]|uniref:Uncharacterized protein n=1 Tax=Zizania palustris TaxID=103762 RepID=A0A8J5RPY3_ZIZPA|nr:hypothetical protein GUJ93_ZPchr0001g29695 [Zizania palustris]
MPMYGGAPMGHPVAGHMVPAAVGTPVMFPPGHAPYVVPVGYPRPREDAPMTIHPTRSADQNTIVTMDKLHFFLVSFFNLDLFFV